MSELLFYFEQGIFHILDPEGIDHMLFVCLLCAQYKPNQIRSLVILLTAFTLGHSISLLTTSLGYQFLPAETIELLILLTILFTAVINFFPYLYGKNIWSGYLLGAFFGLIHGMGFSNFFQSMMMGIDTGSLVPEIISFNLGIEAGQLIIVTAFMLIYFFYEKLSNGPQKYWRWAFSSVGLIFTLYYIIL